MRSIAAVLMLSALAWGLPPSVGRAWSQPKSDWEVEQDKHNWTEGETALPAFPQAADLIEFEVSASTTFRFFIDRASLRVGEDGVVRYTLVARSAPGAETISFEGIRCKGGLFRIYAAGRRDGTWSPRLKSDWSEIQAKTIQRWHQVLRREYFCPQDAIIFDAAEGVDALQRGGHPRKAFTER